MRVGREQFDGALKLNQDGSKLKLSELATYRERVVAAQAKKLRLDQERAAMSHRAYGRMPCVTAWGCCTITRLGK